MQRTTVRRPVVPKPAARTSLNSTRAVAGIMLTALGNAALGVELPDELLRCATEKDDARRLACYDTEIGRLRAPSAAAPVPAPSASVSGSAVATTVAPPGPAKADAGAAPAKPAVAAEDDFGRRGELRKEDERVEPSEVTGSVAAVSRGPDGRLVVTLENGQVWREISPNASVRLQTGDTVRIERGSLGSFLLVAPNKRSTKVTRIR